MAIAAIRYSHGGQSLIAAGFEQPLRLFDVASGEVAHELDGTCRDMRAVAWSPDDQTLAAGGRCGKIRLYDAANGSATGDIAAHHQRVRSLAFSPDGAYLASAGEDRTIHIIPLQQGGEGYRLPLRPAKFMALAFYGPQQLAAAGSDNLIRLWDVAERAEDGSMRLLGRTSVDILKSGGYKLSALEIEEALREHPAVAEVAVVGLPDEAWGDRVVAVIVPRAGREAECGPEAIRSWSKARMALYKVPREVIVTSALPSLPSANSCFR